MTPRLSALIVNFNSGPHLTRCLRSLAEEASGLDWEAIVVDNASTDPGGRPPVDLNGATLISNPENVGFAAAANQAVASSRGSLLLFLNPDSWLTAGALSTLIAELDRRPDAAVVGPAIFDPDGSVQGSARGDPTMFTGLFGRSTWLSTRWPRSPMTRRNVRVYEPLAEGETSVDVDWLSGACMLVRREPFDSVNGFDPQYFLYWEDADLCRRLRAAGWSIRYVPGARAIHQVGQSSRTVPRAAIRAFHQSAYRYYATHVTRGAAHPGRLVARALLDIRCWWKLRQFRPRV
jgi:GT2 family glycosyltransferase